MSETTASRIEADVKLAIQKEIDHAKDAIIKRAVFDFEREVRAAAGQVAIALTNYFTVERMGTELLIHVKIDSGS